MTIRSLAALTATLCLTIATAANAETPPPPVYSWNPATLAATKARIAANPGTLKLPLDVLIAAADKELTGKPESVMQKTKLPPSGDKHDYISLAPYFWANPATKDGLPYVRKDGEHNPEADNPANTDARRLGKMISAVETLSLAYYFTGRAPYATHAAELLRVWFLDPATRMNPNLNFGQAILGVNDGRGIGIIETAGLARIVDSVGLLSDSTVWTPADRKGLTEWMARYLDWLQTSKNGRDEAKTTNNHGTYYDIQIVSLALFTGQNDLARRTLETAKMKRIARQIEPDGSMPEELARTKSLSYSTMNLNGFAQLANLGDRAGVDLWGFQTADGRSIHKAIAFLAPYADPAKPWTGKQITNVNRAALLPLLEEADLHYHDPLFRAALAAGKTTGTERFHLLIAAQP